MRSFTSKQFRAALANQVTHPFQQQGLTVAATDSWRRCSTSSGGSPAAITYKLVEEVLKLSRDDDLEDAGGRAARFEGVSTPLA